MPRVATIICHIFSQYRLLPTVVVVVCLIPFHCHAHYSDQLMIFNQSAIQMLCKGNFNLLIVFQAGLCGNVQVCVCVSVISISSFKSQKQIHWTYSCCYKLANLVLPPTAQRWSENICKWARTLKSLSSAERCCCCCCCSPEIFSNQLLGCVNFVALGQVLFFSVSQPSISGWALFNAVYSIAPPGCPFSACCVCKTTAGIWSILIIVSPLAYLCFPFVLSV